VDLMDIAVRPGSTVWIAHDDRLSEPGWLIQQFENTGQTLSIDGQAMHLFRHHARNQESLTLGANVEQGSAPASMMYLVFVTGE